jgi:hypothetical protein
MPAFSPKKTRQGGYAAILSSSCEGGENSRPVKRGDARSCRIEPVRGEQYSSCARKSLSVGAKTILAIERFLFQVMFEKEKNQFLQ